LLVTLLRMCEERKNFVGAQYIVTATLQSLNITFHACLVGAGNRAFEELYIVCFKCVHRMWLQMRAQPDDMDKVSEHVRDESHVCRLCTSCVHTSNNMLLPHCTTN
jgi:hypothetical protein